MNDTNPHYKEESMGKSFVLFFCAPVLTLFFAIMGLNIIVDPLALFSDPQPNDILAEKPFRSIPEHLTLPLTIRNANAIGTLIVGSSTSRQLLETPGNRIRASKTDRRLFPNDPIFNAALGGGTVHMALDVIRHALAFHDIKEIVYVLNFDGLSAKRNISENYHSENYDGRAGGQSYARILPFLWNADTALDSLKTLVLNSPLDSKPLGIAKADTLSIRKRWLRNTRDYMYVGLYADFVMTSAETDAINDMISLAKSKDIKFTVMASPIHPIQMEMIYQANVFGAYAKHLRVISDIAQTNGIDFIAFDIYASPFSDNYIDVDEQSLPKDAPLYWDGVHFSPGIGIEMVKFMKSGKSIYGDSFGIHLTNSNVDSYVKTLVHKRDLYLRNNEYVREFIEDALKTNPRLN